MRACGSTDIIAFTRKRKSYGRQTYSITVVQKALVLHTKAFFFFFRNNNFLGANESIKYFRNPYALNFSKNIILKFSALKCFHVEIMMEGTEQFHVPTMKFSKKA